MNKPLLYSSLAAAALLSGCRVYLPGECPRRTVFVNSNTTVRTEQTPVARVSEAGAPDHSAPSSDRIAPGPVVSPTPMQVTEPTPVVGVVTGVLLPAGTNPNATSSLTVAPPVLPPTAGADSYRNYMGKGSSSASSPAANRPAAAPAPAATPAPAPAAGGVQPVSGGYRMYTVQKGDTAGTIANANGMTLAEFVKLNNLSDPNRLRVGQTVKVATGRPALSGRRAGSAAAATPAPTATPVQRAQNAVHPVQATAPTPTTRPVVSLPPPTTRPPARVTAAEASAAPGSTVKAGDVTVDVDAALAGGGLAAARQRAQNAAQDAAHQVRNAAQAAGDQAQAALSQVSDAAGRAADAASSAAAGTQEYVVQETEDIYSIAMKFNTEPLKLRSLNGGRSLDDLEPGTRILVPAAGAGR